MAATLKVTDGTNTVNFLDSTDLYLAKDGWKPKVARQNEAGDGYEDVIEIITLYWMETVDSLRALTIHTLEQLNTKAKTYWRQNKVDDWVWMEVRTTGESSSRFARVKAIEVDELDSRHFGPARTADLVVTITREGAYSEVSPATTANTVNKSLSSVYNKQSGTSTTLTNRVKTETTLTFEKYGVPGPVIIEMEESSQQETIIIAQRYSQDETREDTFYSHLNALDFQSTTNIVDDASAPSGKKWERTGLSGVDSETKGAFVNGMTYYTGTYLVYAVIKVSADDIFDITIGQNTTATTLNNALPTVVVPTTTNYQMLYCGRLSIPPGGKIPGLSSSTTWYINMRVGWKGAGGSESFAIRNIFLVPVDYGVMLITPATIRRTVDSRLERVYSYDASNKYLQDADIVRGKFFHMEPNVYHYLHFFCSRSDADGGVDPADTIDINLRMVPRFLSLRGSF